MAPRSGARFGSRAPDAAIIDTAETAAAARLADRNLLPSCDPGRRRYLWLASNEGRPGFILWDRRWHGHGAAAALLTTLAKLLFHHGSMDHDSPASLMEAVDNDFRSTFGARSFMTAMCVALDPATGQAQVVGAGHPPLLVVRRDGTTESIPSAAPPLGLIERAAFNETAVGLEPRDAFLLYTDGLFWWSKDERSRLSRAVRKSAGSFRAQCGRVAQTHRCANSSQEFCENCSG